MKDLKTQFEQYQSPMDEAGWETISQDPTVMKYNKGRLVRRIAGYTLGGLTTIAAASALILAGTMGTRSEVGTNQPSEPVPVTQEMISATPATDKTVAQAAPLQEVPTAPETPATQAENTDIQLVATTLNTPVTEPVVAVAPAPNNIPNTPVVFNMQPKSGTGSLQPILPANTEIPNVSRPIQHPEETVADIDMDNDPTAPLKSARNNELPNSFWAPNAFSPNGDGKNEKFYVFADSVNYTIDANTFELNVFTRNGQLVFHTRDINEGWNGRIQNTGSPLAPGVYIYTIRFKIKDNPKFQKGTITLLK